MIREYLRLDMASLPRSDPVKQTCSILCELLKTDENFVAEYESLQSHKVSCGSSPLDRSHELFCASLQSFEGRGRDLKPESSDPKQYFISTLKDLEQGSSVEPDPLVHEALTTLSNIFDLNQIKPVLKKALSNEKPLETIGKIIWLVDNEKPENWLAMDPKETLSYINDSFHEGASRLVERLKRYGEVESALKIQPARVLEGTRIPIEIAKFIITSKGDINTGLLQTMLHLFTGDNEVVLNHDISIKQTLELLLNSPSIRKSFSQIRCPERTHSRLETLIRVSLGLRRDVSITDTDTKRVAMAALLSHLRQYANRSCFAAFLAINMKQGYLEECLSDLKSLLQNGHLTRVVSGAVRHFPFLMKMSNASLSRSFNIDSEGHVLRRGEIVGSITKSSGLLAACKIMGISDPPKALLQVAKETHGEVTPKLLIEKLARQMAKKKSGTSSPGKYYHEGCFAFGSKETNPLLKVWVNTIAGMAEGQANCYLSSCLIKSTLEVFHRRLIQSNPEDADQLEERLLKDLSLSVRYMYDPSLGFVGSENDGGFVLYEVSRDGKSIKRIDSSRSFREFLVRVVEKSEEKLEKRSFLSEAIPSSSFIQEIVRAYKDQIQGSYLDFDEADKVTPWINLFGHNAHTILQVYFENPASISTYKMHPKNGYDLLKEILKLGRKLAPEIKEAFLKNAYTLKPVRILNFHAFSLMLGHSSIRDAWTTENGVKSWMKSRLLNRGREIASKPMSEKQRKSLAELYPGLDIPKGASPREFRKQAVRQLEMNRKQAVIDLDKRLIETFPLKERKRLNETLIHFADTNLRSGIQDVHFCFLVNPGSGKVEVWQVNDDNTGLTPLDQKMIAKKAHWEVYLDPGSLV